MKVLAVLKVFFKVQGSLRFKKGRTLPEATGYAEKFKVFFFKVQMARTLLEAAEYGESSRFFFSPYGGVKG